VGQILVSRRCGVAGDLVGEHHSEGGGETIVGRKGQDQTIVMLSAVAGGRPKKLDDSWSKERWRRQLVGLMRCMGWG
jgi:hypothetical protein